MATRKFSSDRITRVEISTDPFFRWVDDTTDLNIKEAQDGYEPSHEYMKTLCDSVSASSDNSETLYVRLSFINQEVKQPCVVYVAKRSWELTVPL